MAESLTWATKLKSILLARSKSAESNNNNNNNNKLFSSKEDFEQVCVEAGVSSTAIINRTWERSFQGKKFNRIEDVCWYLLNTSNTTSATSSNENENEEVGKDSSSTTTTNMNKMRRKQMESTTENNNNNDSSSSAAASASNQQQQLTPEVISSTSLISFYHSLLLSTEIFTQQEFQQFLQSLCTSLPMALRFHNQSESKKVCAELLSKKFEVVKQHEFSSSSSSNQQQQQKQQNSVLVNAYSCSDQEYKQATQEQEVTKSGHSGGLWSFQELVSMLPVAVLDIESSCSNKVLDMCAAPGSKSLQGLDMLNYLETHNNNNNNNNNGGEGGGCLIANEKQAAKARQILPTRMKKYHALQAVVTCCDASRLPWIVFPSAEKSQQEACAAIAKQQHQSTTTVTSETTYDFDDPVRCYFDRIICDVPCSGDGTARKDRSIFGTWSLDYVKTLSATQMAIARRGLGLLSIGGKMCYSTCSMNPVEDEHVVFQLLCLSRGSIELVDVNEEFDKVLNSSSASSASASASSSKLKSRGGIDLDVFSSKLNNLKSENENDNNDSNEESSSSFLKSVSLEAAIEKVPAMFRPSTREEAVAISKQIAKCVLRVFPHRNNTGGFFVALFKKKSHIAAPLPNAKKWQKWSNLKRFELVTTPEQDEDWKKIVKWFGLEKSFSVSVVSQQQNNSNNNNNSTSTSYERKPLPPHAVLTLPKSNKQLVPVWCLTPTTGQRKRIHFTTPDAVQVVFETQCASGTPCEVVMVGVRGFEKLQDKYMMECPQRLRIVTESAELIGEIATKRSWGISCVCDSSSSSSSSTTNDEENAKKCEIVTKLLTDGFIYLNAENEFHRKVLFPDIFIQNNDDSAAASATTASSSSTSIFVESGTFLLPLTLTRNNLQTTIWCAAMLTSTGKIDLNVEYPQRRLLMMTFFDVVLPYNSPSSSNTTATQNQNSNSNQEQQENENENNNKVGGGKRRNRKNGSDDEDDDYAGGDEEDDMENY